METENFLKPSSYIETQKEKKNIVCFFFLFRLSGLFAESVVTGLYSVKPKKEVQRAETGNFLQLYYYINREK